MIRLHEKAPHASFARQYKCTIKGEPTIANEFECNGQRYQLMCQTTHSCGEPHHIEVGYVEYTTMGMRLFDIIDEKPIVSLEELIVGHYRGHNPLEEYHQIVKLWGFECMTVRRDNSAEDEIITIYHILSNKIHGYTLCL